MGPFTWFLIAVGVVIVGAVVWQSVRKSSRGVDESAVNRNTDDTMRKGGSHGVLPPG
ncbi:hypothetical protein GCM10007979_33530 [Nocardioides albus]|uniref:Uncharacterized protein n=1 Tax=Nocardioides albus TaxID=1841 RepID=A0A7W5A8T5_9ACTN|nr:hypothetical protein [Nocardioides albus]GGU31794.1 hypothetical protein GCM10007979_33530 [Nocardioides albus]